jgi:hypothetical protein
MPKPFIQLTVDEFLDLLSRFNFARKINSVHMHHTFIPRQSQFRGLPTIEAMERDHREKRGFSDIAQHITIDPKGMIWSGRSWNRAPASAVGFNGNSQFGPFMFETIGDFDQGQETLAGDQKETVLTVIASVQKKFKLPPESLRFHNQMSSKSCPGTSIRYESFLDEVRARHLAITEREESRKASRAAGAPFGSQFAETSHPSDLIRQALDALSNGASRSGAEGDEGELDEKEMTAESRSLLAGFDGYTESAAGADRGLLGPGKLTAEEKAHLRPHVVNLRAGQLIEGGDFFTLEGDVQAIFRQHLEQEAARKKQAGEKLRVLFYAHGGLVSETAGLRRALTHVDWWKDNGIYPIYFTWETGLLQHVGRLLRDALPGARGISDISDHLLEKAARRLGGEKIWTSMKSDAERAAQPGGGSDFVAAELADFCKRHPNVELHAVGHSAGAIFHNHFLPTAFHKGVKPFESLHLMAPALRVDGFHRRLEPEIRSNNVKQVTMFTMKTDFERDDNCATIYRKSLLYLIHFALEPEERTDLLGLEESLRRDPVLVKLFGLEGYPPGDAEIVFSKSLTTSGRSASRSTEHGGFDDDQPTMNSIALRVLGLPDNGTIKPYPEGKSRAFEEDPWATPDLSDLFPAAPASFSSEPAAFSFTPASPVTPAAYGAAPAVATGTAQGARKALCVGINTYSRSPLSGCVADARQWESTLQSLGFKTQRLLDGEATFERMRSELRQLVRGSRAGDVVVFQYAGHGTQVPDLDGDEEQTGPDEALCPVDFDKGRLLIDDDIADILADLPPGVNFTFFMDNCNSGDVSRFGLGRNAPEEDGDARMRFITLTPDLEAAYREFRQRGEGARALNAAPKRRALRGVLFAACQADEPAWELNGHGAFTVRATPLLLQAGAGLTNKAFHDQVLRAFGTSRKQTPVLKTTDDLLNRPLLAPLTTAAVPAGGRGLTGADPAALAEEVQRFAERLRGLCG